MACGVCPGEADDKWPYVLVTTRSSAAVACSARPSRYKTRPLNFKREHDGLPMILTLQPRVYDLLRYLQTFEVFRLPFDSLAPTQTFVIAAGSLKAEATSFPPLNKLVIAIHVHECSASLIQEDHGGFFSAAQRRLQNLAANYGAQFELMLLILMLSWSGGLLHPSLPRPSRMRESCSIESRHRCRCRWKIIIVVIDMTFETRSQEQHQQVSQVLGIACQYQLKLF